MSKILNPKTFRFYEQDWVKLPSVTTVLQLHPDPDFITSWKERIWVEWYIEHMNKLAARWTVLHKVCENFFLENNNIIPTELEYQKFINWFYSFVWKYWQYITPLDDDNKYKIEYNLYSDVLWYAWTCDLICKVQWKQTLIDWKTSSSSSLWWEMLEKYKMQTVAYAVLYNNYNFDKVEQIMIVVLTNNRKDWLWNIEIVERKDFEFYFNSFLNYLIEFNLVYNDWYKVDFNWITF